MLDPWYAAMIGDDFNAKHISWCYRRPNHRGWVRMGYFHGKGDTAVTAPVEPTDYPPRVNCMPDVLDIFLVKGLVFQLGVEVIEDLSSDHGPVMATIATRLSRDCCH